MVIMSFLMYAQYKDSVQDTIIRENKQILGQVALNVGLYTKNMMRVSDSMYYKVIKNTDLGNDADGALARDMNLIYEVNNDNLVSIALFAEDGRLITATPNASQKKDVNVADQEWFKTANTVVENVHFGAPHIENIFQDSSLRYRWVISLSRAVELTNGGNTSRGVLLVDMDYSGMGQIFSQTTTQSAGLTYLIDSNGEIIYHPKEDLIFSGLYEENNITAATYRDGEHREHFGGAERTVIVKTAGYTGWKLVIVIPDSEFALGYSQMTLFIIFIVLLSLLIIVVANIFISYRVAKPIKRLDTSVRAMEEGEKDPDIYVGGPYEIEHLGKTITGLVGSMNDLMGRIVTEQEDKRKSELDALQAQINPHFLYNTLDSIVWMIESGGHKEAISMVTSLANLFRISLSRGKNIIPIAVELDHAKYYLHIQNIRYKNKFALTMDIDPAVLGGVTIKLIVQPLIENAIYHAMEVLDGDGEILIKAYRRDDDVFIEITDNGLGMTEDKIQNLLDLSGTEQISSGRKGSGIGVRNVHERIRLYFGEAYGLEIESELDEGTTVRIHLPYVKSEEEG
jgi:two-component system sensor histidine kinase YesM